jgi:hypothetical protein
LGANWEQVVKPYLDSKVDNFADETQAIDQLPTLSLDLDDRKIVRNLEARIKDSEDYWNNSQGFNLKTTRQKNIKFYLGRQIDEGQLYRFQIPYNENELFVAVESTVAYLTSQDPQPEVYPASDGDGSKILASDLEKGMRGHGQIVGIRKLLESVVRNLMIKQVGYLYLWFDPDYGENGEIRVTALDPDHVVVDKNAARGENPAFICITRKDTVEELCYRFPEKRKEILEQMGIKYETGKQMSQVVSWRQVWITHYDTGAPEEGCVSYLKQMVLAKYRDPNWLYTTRSKNFLPMPRKPVIPFNYINSGQHWIDDTTPMEQASWLQEILNKRGRQIMENADSANGFLVISAAAMSMDDAENLTGDPNQKIVVNDTGRPISEDILNLQGRQLPNYVVEDKVDLRNTIHSIMGTPAQFRGDDDNLSETATTNMMVKNQASGRQDLIVRAIDTGFEEYFNFLAQMMVVHYTEKHFVTVNSSDGDFDYITMHRDLIERAMNVSVKSGSTLPFDKARQESVALNLAKAGLIDPLNLYKDLHMDNPQKRYDAWAKWKVDPMALARDAMDEMDDTTAYIDFIEAMGGKKPKPRDDASKEHILIHRKQMVSDTFFKANKAKQDNFVQHVAAEVESLQLRTDLDVMAQAGVEALAPSNPIVPATPPGAPGMMPPGAPMPPQGGGLPPGAPTPMGASGAGMPPMPSMGSVMGGGQQPPAPELTSPGAQPPLM